MIRFDVLKRILLERIRLVLNLILEQLTVVISKLSKLIAGSEPTSPSEKLERVVIGLHRGISSLSLLSMMVIILLTLIIWASNTSLDQVVRASGTVQPETPVYSVQARYSGTVKQVFVSLGASIEVGDILYEIDPEDAASEVNKLTQAISFTKANIFRLEALQDGTELKLDEIPDAIQEQQIQMYESAKYGSEAQIQKVELEIDNLRLKLEELRDGADFTRKKLSLAKRERALIEPLVNDGIEPKIRLLDLEKQQTELEQLLSESKSKSSQLAKEIGAKKSNLNQVKQDSRKEISSELAQEHEKLKALVADLEFQRSRNSKGQIISPVKGFVSAVFVKNSGEVTQPGIELAEIVPSDTTYKVVARVLPKDVKSLQVGQPAKISLDAFDFTDFGQLKAVVEKISGNTQTDPNDGSKYYEVDLSVQTSDSEIIDRGILLRSGLTGSVEFIEGEKTVLGYLFDPFTKVASKALRQ